MGDEVTNFPVYMSTYMTYKYFWKEFNINPFGENSLSRVPCSFYFFLLADEEAKNQANESKRAHKEPGVKSAAGI